MHSDYGTVIRHGNFRGKNRIALAIRSLRIAVQPSWVLRIRRAQQRGQHNFGHHEVGAARTVRGIPIEREVVLFIQRHFFQEWQQRSES